MVNVRTFRRLIDPPVLPPVIIAMALTALLLAAAAWRRGAEYDEQYTLFLTAGIARPIWPASALRAATIAALQRGHAAPLGLARDLRATDVHPPLYFWAILCWRWLFGPSLWAARLFSVLCGTVSAGLIGSIARRARIPATPAILLTVGCYGFAYTGAIARDFALALTLTLAGVLAVQHRRKPLAGLCFGAAFACNYLALFVAGAVILVAGAWSAIATMLPFVALDAWFVIAQYNSRPGQFPPFAVWPSLARLAKYQVAAVFGGLPLYVPLPWRLPVAALVGSAAIGLVLLIASARPWCTQPVFLAAVLATPIGLLLLGLLFNNTPIELRYLCFGLPFLGLLTSHALHNRPPGRLRHSAFAALLLLQACGIAGLLFAPGTMQPAARAAAEARRIASHTITLVPAGNDGVGIVGAFGIEAPPNLRILILHPRDPLALRLAPYGRVALAVLRQDRQSARTIDIVRRFLRRNAWHRQATAPDLEVYVRSHVGG